MRKKIKIFDLDYLVNADYTDDDLYLLFNTPSLLYSLLNAEFKLAGYNMSDKQLKTIVKQKNWQYKYFWSNNDIREKFEHQVIKVFENMYQCSSVEAQSREQWFLIQYGLSSHKIKNSKYTNYLDE